MAGMKKEEIDQILILLTDQLLTESGNRHQLKIGVHDSLYQHLGIDSLARAELFKRIENKFERTLPDTLIQKAETLNDIAIYLLEMKPEILFNDPKAHAEVHAHDEATTVDPGKAKTLIDLLSMHAFHTPDKTHVYFQHENSTTEKITYSNLFVSALKIAHGLKGFGLKSGDTVAIMLPTCPGFFYAFLGILLAGGIPVPIYPPFRMYMLESYGKTESIILRNAETRILITFNEAKGLSHLLQSFVPSLKLVTDVETLLTTVPLPFDGKHNDFRPEQFAFIQYTSGSTANPKGVLLTHHNLLTNIRAYGKAINAGPQDVTVSWLPLYHDMGLIGMWLGSLYYGAPLVLMPPFTFLNHPEKWLWAIHYYRGTISGGPNFAYELCATKIAPERLEGLDLSSWRIAANGAEKIYPATLEKFATYYAKHRFNRRALLPMYGLAESTVALTIPTLDHDFKVDHVERKTFEEKGHAIPTKKQNAIAFVDCGVPVVGQEVRIVDEKNQLLPERQVGKIQFRGPSSLQGYYHNPEATAAIFVDGWWETGDLGYQADGGLYITGRKKDVIIKAGRNYYPLEIEEITGNIPGIRQGCVTAFGVTNHTRGTEEIIIVAETKEKESEQRKILTAKIQEMISSVLDLVPDKILLVKPHTIPKTSSGKLQRARTKLMYEKGQLENKLTPPWLQVVKISVQSILARVNTWAFLSVKFLFTLYMAMITIITIIPLYPVVLFSSRKTATRACRLWARSLFIFGFSPLTVAGSDKLSSATPCLYVANHQSYLDALLLLIAIKGNMHIVSKKELFKVPLVQLFLKKTGAIPVDRHDFTQSHQDTRIMLELLKKGESVAIFPEGTFSYASGLRPFRLGAFKIAAEANVPIYPIAINGSRKILRGENKTLFPHTLKVTIMDPILPTGTDWQNLNQLSQQVREKIAEHCGEPSLDFIAAHIVGPKNPEETGG